MALASLSCLLLLGVAQRASAQESNTAQTGKGIGGGGMMGAEIVLIGEAAIGLEPGWAYLVGGIAGAGAGGLAGYYIGDGSTSKAPSFLLAGGIALVIPAMIGVVSATHFQPPENYRQDVVPEDEPPIEDEPPGAQLELPTLRVDRVFTDAEVHTFGVAQATEVNVSVLRGVF
jgi:hypothetical protein